MKKLIALLLALALLQPFTAWQPSTVPRSPWTRSTPPAESIRLN